MSTQISTSQVETQSHDLSMSETQEPESFDVIENYEKSDERDVEMKDVHSTKLIKPQPPIDLSITDQLKYGRGVVLGRVPKIWTEIRETYAGLRNFPTLAEAIAFSRETGQQIVSQLQAKMVTSDPEHENAREALPKIYQLPIFALDKPDIKRAMPLSSSNKTQTALQAPGSPKKNTSKLTSAPTTTGTTSVNVDKTQHTVDEYIIPGVGSKTFLVTGYQKFAKELVMEGLRKDPTKVNYYETLAEGCFSHINIDAEFSKELNPDVNVDAMQENLLAVIDTVFQKYLVPQESGLTLSLPTRDTLTRTLCNGLFNITILESSTPTYFSRHYLFSSNKYCMLNNLHAGAVIRLVEIEILKKWGTDTSKNMFWVKTPTGILKCIIDLGVYNRDRQMRPAGCTKKNTVNYLEKTLRPINTKFQDLTADMVLNSLILRVAPGSEILSRLEFDGSEPASVGNSEAMKIARVIEAGGEPGQQKILWKKATAANSKSAVSDETQKQLDSQQSTQAAIDTNVVVNQSHGFKNTRMDITDHGNKNVNSREEALAAYERSKTKAFHQVNKRSPVLQKTKKDATKTTTTVSADMEQKESSTFDRLKIAFINYFNVRFLSLHYFIGYNEKDFIFTFASTDMACPRLGRSHKSNHVYRVVRLLSNPRPLVVVQPRAQKKKTLSCVGYDLQTLLAEQEEYRKQLKITPYTILYEIPTEDDAQRSLTDLPSVPKGSEDLFVPCDMKALPKEFFQQETVKVLLMKLGLPRIIETRLAVFYEGDLLSFFKMVSECQLPLGLMVDSTCQIKLLVIDNIVNAFMLNVCIPDIRIAALEKWFEHFIVSYSRQRYSLFLQRCIERKDFDAPKDDKEKQEKLNTFLCAIRQETRTRMEEFAARTRQRTVKKRDYLIDLEETVRQRVLLSIPNYDNCWCEFCLRWLK